MQTYTFHFIDRDGEARAFDLCDCASEHEAKDLLPGLFEKHPTCGVIELWNDSGKLFSAQRLGAVPIEGGVAAAAGWSIAGVRKNGRGVGRKPF